MVVEIAGGAIAQRFGSPTRLGDRGLFLDADGMASGDQSFQEVVEARDHTISNHEFMLPRQPIKNRDIPPDQVISFLDNC
jgi:hypothetical protein